MHDDKAPMAAAQKRVWITPRVILGSASDTEADSAQPPNDGLLSPTVAAS